MWGHLFHSITEFNIHQNELMWSRMKVLLTVEGFILTSGYATKGSYIAPALFVIGILIVVAIWKIFLRDKKYRDMYYRMLKDIIDKSEIDYKFKLERPEGITGTKIFEISCKTLALINLSLAFLSLYAVRKNIDILKLLSADP